jgi:hypothetical protein
MSGKGKRLSEARWDLDSKLDYVIFFGTVQALVLTEEMMEKTFPLYMARMESNVNTERHHRIVTSRSRRIFCP